MDMDISGQQLIKKHLREIAFKLSIPEVATCDVHYLNQDDSYLHEVVLAINSRKKISDTSRFTYPTNEFWLKDYDSLKDLFTSSEISTTLEIAERCNVDIDFESTKIPRYPRLPEGVSSYDYLRDLIYKGFEFRGFSLDNKEYVDRIKMELADIKEAELADYFLILHDIIVWAKDSGIWVGPGRGSAGGSLIAYVLRITEIDPLEYGLLWERFYNVGRKGSMPDIDTDVEIDRREDVLDYIRNTFGENYVCQMITFNTLSTKAILKDIGKVFDIDFKIMNDITDQVPKKVKNLADALEQSELLQESEKKYKKIFVIAKELEGIIKSVGTHAAAVVISNQDIYQGCLPLHWDAGNKKMVTGCSMYCLDDLKYLKLDVLGLKTLSVLKMAERLVNEKNKNSDGEQ